MEYCTQFSYSYSMRVQSGRSAKKNQGAREKKDSHRRSLPKTGLFRLTKMGLKMISNSIGKLGKTMLWNKKWTTWNAKDDISAELLNINFS